MIKYFHKWFMAFVLVSATIFLLPPENYPYVFNTPLRHGVGILDLKDGSIVHFLTKNTTRTEVYLDTQSRPTLWYLQSQPSPTALKKGSILPNSIVIGTFVSAAPTTRIVVGNALQKPGRLTILTDSERHAAFLGCGVLVLLFGVLLMLCFLILEAQGFPAQDIDE